VWVRDVAGIRKMMKSFLDGMLTYKDILSKIIYENHALGHFNVIIIFQFEKKVLVHKVHALTSPSMCLYNP
jgi:hypothetical protein